MSIYIKHVNIYKTCQYIKNMSVYIHVHHVYQFTYIASEKSKHLANQTILGYEFLRVRFFFFTKVDQKVLMYVTDRP